MDFIGKSDYNSPKQQVPASELKTPLKENLNYPSSPSVSMSDTNPPAASVNKVIADGIPVIDLNRFSQSELYALSRLTKSSPPSCDDVVIPKIDRSIFNESTDGIYPNLHHDLPSHSSATSSHIPTGNAANPDPVNAENAQIIKELKKQLLMLNADPGELVDDKVDSSDSRLHTYSLSSVIGTGQKRKGGRPRKSGVLPNEGEMESMEVPAVDVKKSDDSDGKPYFLRSRKCRGQ